MGLAQRIWHVQMPKQLNGSWGTQQYHRLLGAQKRYEGKELTPLSRPDSPLMFMLVASLFPMILRPLPEVQGYAECDVCMCVRGPRMQT